MTMVSSHITALKNQIARTGGRINFVPHHTDGDSMSSGGHYRPKYAPYVRKSMLANNQYAQQPQQLQPQVQQPQAQVQAQPVQQTPQTTQQVMPAVQNMQTTPIQNYSYNYQQYPGYQLVQSYPYQAQYPQMQYPQAQYQYPPMQYQQAQTVNNASASLNATNAYTTQTQAPQTQGQNLKVTSQA